MHAALSYRYLFVDRIFDELLNSWPDQLISVEFVSLIGGFVDVDQSWTLVHSNSIVFQNRLCILSRHVNVHHLNLRPYWASIKLTVSIEMWEFRIAHGNSVNDEHFIIPPVKAKLICSTNHQLGSGRLRGECTAYQFKIVPTKCPIEITLNLAYIFLTG
jgi:hypothetical protein